MGLGDRHAKRHETDAVAKVAGVDSSIYWEHRPGDRVLTCDGFVGKVSRVDDGPYPGSEQYLVVLERGLGGGHYTASQLTAARVVTADHHTAADDYPEFGTIIQDRPDPALDVTATKQAAWNDSDYESGELPDYDEDEGEEGPDEEDSFIHTHAYGGYDAIHGGTYLGSFPNHGAAHHAIFSEEKRTGWYPNLWHVNDHGNVSLDDDTSRERAKWEKDPHKWRMENDEDYAAEHEKQNEEDLGDQVDEAMEGSEHLRGLLTDNKVGPTKYSSKQAAWNPDPTAPCTSSGCSWDHPHTRQDHEDAMRARWVENQRLRDAGQCDCPGAKKIEPHGLDEHSDWAQRNYEAGRTDAWGVPLTQPFDGHGAFNCNNRDCTEHPQSMYPQDGQIQGVPGWLEHDAAPDEVQGLRGEVNDTLKGNEWLLDQQRQGPSKYSKAEPRESFDRYSDNLMRISHPDDKSFALLTDGGMIHPGCREEHDKRYPGTEYTGVSWRDLRNGGIPHGEVCDECTMEITPPRMHSERECQLGEDCPDLDPKYGEGHIPEGKIDPNHWGSHEDLRAAQADQAEWEHTYHQQKHDLEYAGSEIDQMFSGPEHAKAKEFLSGNPHGPTFYSSLHSSEDGFDPYTLVSEAASDPDFRFHVTASWSDVRAKAKRIRSEGHVRIVAARDGQVTAEVKGDHHVYETQIQYAPGRAKVAVWNCACKWGSYSWGRRGVFKKFEGRMCSHVLALTYEAQARTMFGREMYEDPKRPSWMKPHSPVVVEYNKDKGKNVTRREVPPGNMRRTFSSVIEPSPIHLLAFQSVVVEGEPLDEVQAMLRTASIRTESWAQFIPMVLRALPALTRAAPAAAGAGEGAAAGGIGNTLKGMAPDLIGNMLSGGGGSGKAQERTNDQEYHTSGPSPVSPPEGPQGPPEPTSDEPVQDQGSTATGPTLNFEADDEKRKTAAEKHPCRGCAMPTTAKRLCTHCKGVRAFEMPDPETTHPGILATHGEIMMRLHQKAKEEGWSRDKISFNASHINLRAYMAQVQHERENPQPGYFAHPELNEAAELTWQMRYGGGDEGQGNDPTWLPSQFQRGDKQAAVNNPWGENVAAEPTYPNPYGATSPRDPYENPASAGFASGDGDPENWNTQEPIAMGDRIASVTGESEEGDTDVCANCGETVRRTTIDPNVPWVHHNTGNAYCDVEGPSDATLLAGSPLDRPEAAPLVHESAYDEAIFEPSEGAEALLRDEPEPALPTTDGEGVMGNSSNPGEVKYDDVWSPESESIMATGSQDVLEEFQRTARHLDPGSGSGDTEIAQAAKDFLAKTALKDFTPGEQAMLINEGQGMRAANLDRLEIKGTHYEALDQMGDEDDEGWLS